MGCDIVAIANHGLDTASLELLAADLSMRLNALVRFGYRNEEYDFVPGGEVGSGARVLNLCSDLEDDDYPGVVAYNLYDGSDYERYYIWIHRDCFRVFADYPSGRFGIFCHSFMGKDKYWDDKLQYRIDVYKEALLFGGDTAIYFGDQCGASFVGNDAETMPFAAILHKLSALENVVYLSSWLRDFSGEYEADDPKAFVDDFGYWPEVADMVARSG